MKSRIGLLLGFGGNVMAARIMTTVTHYANGCRYPIRCQLQAVSAESCVIVHAAYKPVFELQAITDGLAIYAEPGGMVFHIAEPAHHLLQARYEVQS